LHQGVIRCLGHPPQVGFPILGSVTDCKGRKAALGDVSDSS
jgi:hypothetical protein